MNRTFGTGLLALLSGAISLIAIEKPPAAFQELMKSSGAIIEITLGTIGSVSGAGAGQENRTASLRAHLKTRGSPLARMQWPPHAASVIRRTGSCN